MSHGTHVASIIFGQHKGPIPGVAPRCRGLLIPIFSTTPAGAIAPCSMSDLARAINVAIANGAHIINISGGKFVRWGVSEADPLLVQAIRKCADRNILVVAAAGNEGCACLHVPAALPMALAVGAMDSDGVPLDSTNWGEVYQTQGILAPGARILGAMPGGGVCLKSGTSFAAPVVAGVAGLLMSMHHQTETAPEASSIRSALLKSAIPCDQQGPQETMSCKRYLAGTLNVSEARVLIAQQLGEPYMSNPQNEVSDGVDTEPREALVLSTSSEPSDDATSSPNSVVMAAEPSNSAFAKNIASAPSPSQFVHPMAPKMTNASAVQPSECTTCATEGGAQFVYALGELDVDFGSDARRDSFTQSLPANASLADHFKDNPQDASSVHWILKLDSTPIYAIAPVGAFAHVVYQRLLEFYTDDAIERISIPGYVTGHATLLSGQSVPTVVPELRGMYSWSTKALLENLTQGVEDEQERGALSGRVEDYLTRIYYDFRNLGLTPQDRALNFSASNAFQVLEVVSKAKSGHKVLQSIDVEKSPICRPGSDCYDVKLSFFDPENNQRSRRVFRFTVDVSDVIPVTVGTVRSWNEA